LVIVRSLFSAMCTLLVLCALCFCGSFLQILGVTWGLRVGVMGTGSRNLAPVLGVYARASAQRKCEISVTL
jgi:hypothetical protein